MRRAVCLIAIVIATVALTTTPAHAVELDGGCQGQGASLDKDGNQIMAATAPSAEPGTSSNPFLVDYDGTVDYAGSGPLILNHHWDVKVFGITVKSGGAENGSHETTTQGTAVVSDYLPFKITGVYYVSGGISGEGGACSGNAFMKLIGSPVGTIPWIVAIALIAGGLALGYASLPKAKPRSLAYVDSSASMSPPAAPPSAPPIAEPIPEPVSPQEHAPFAPPEPTVEQPPAPASPPAPPPPPPSEGSPA